MAMEDSVSWSGAQTGDALLDPDRDPSTSMSESSLSMSASAVDEPLRKKMKNKRSSEVRHIPILWIKGSLGI